MLAEVTDHFGFRTVFKKYGFKNSFETKQSSRVTREIKHLSKCSGLVIVTGGMGIGKTTSILQTIAHLKKEKQVIVSQSLAVEKEKVSVNTLMSAIFSDLAKDRKNKVPATAEKRERTLCELISAKNKPVLLFIDEAHDLTRHTLNSLKRLVEVVHINSKFPLSLILIGLPRLKNNICRSSMEEVGARTEIIELEGMNTEEKIQFSKWLITSCTEKNKKTSEIIDDSSIKLLAEKVATPLQIEQALELAFTQAYQMGENKVSKEIMEHAIAKDINAVDAKLARLGYKPKDLAEVLHIRPAEARNFINGKLTRTRFEELRDGLLQVGVPL